jgi:hypothetical protein
MPLFTDNERREFIDHITVNSNSNSSSSSVTVNSNGTVDWREVGHKLRAIASAHGANVVAYQIAGAEIRVQFLRATDNIYKALLGQKDMQPSR